ncbi:MAG TPA: DNA replication/repair protein RecF [Gammaproteobacteria bacterium]|nr:DNA replication/repair protein RecF [Gammaproteobacteria bacterium]
MALRSLGARDFRCFVELELEFADSFNIVLGDNASGKTSLLEAIYFLGRGRSFREARRRVLVRHGCRATMVFGRVGADEGPGVALGLRLGEEGVQGRVSGQKAAGIGELAAWLPVQVIDPHVHRLLEGGPADRRRFMDWGVFHVEHAYLAAWRRYARALRQRNAILRRGGPDAGREARAWDAELGVSGAEVDRARAGFVERIGPHVEGIASRVLGRECQVRLAYRRGWPEEMTLDRALASHLQRDRERGHTVAGPHRAELDIRVEGRPAREWVSRGQGKVLSAALVLSEIRSAAEAGRGNGVLLVDDAGAELGPGYRARLWAVLDELPAQKFVTGVSLSEVRGGLAGGHGRMFHVEHGRVREVVE